MTRLPSKRTLESMPGNRHAILDAHARDLRDEIAGLKSGHVFVTNGLTKGQALKNARARLARVYRMANEYGDFVGQPDRLRIRVRAPSRSMSA